MQNTGRNPEGAAPNQTIHTFHTPFTRVSHESYVCTPSSPHHLITTPSRGTLQDVPHLARPSTHEDLDLSHAFVSLNFVTEEGTRARSASELEYTFEGPITPVKVISNTLHGLH